MADTRFGLSSVAIGAMITSGMMVTTAIAPFTGLWADRISKCALIAAGGLSAAAGMLVLACLTRWWEVYLAIEALTPGRRSRQGAGHDRGNEHLA